MNDFFTSLIGRHLGTCDIIQPRTLGRFEVDRGRVAVASPDEGTSTLVSENDQPLQPRQSPGEAPYGLPKKTASEVNSLELAVAKADHPDHPIVPPSIFSVDAPKVTIHKPGSIENKKDYSSPSLPEQSDPSAKLGLTEQQSILSDSPVFPGKPYATQLLDTDRHAHTNINDLREAMSDKETSLPQRVGEHHLEHELTHRIRAMLQRLADDPVPPTTEPTQDDRGSQVNESLMSMLPETETPLLDSAVTSPDPTPTLEKHTSRQAEMSADDRGKTVLYSPLEIPSWLPEMAAQLSQRLQEKEAKAEPVINVTIGRVEVRAVQSEAPKNAQHSKKPTGVMTLDQYLNRREGRGAR